MTLPKELAGSVLGWISGMASYARTVVCLSPDYLSHAKPVVGLPSWITSIVSPTHNSTVDRCRGRSSSPPVR